MSRLDPTLITKPRRVQRGAKKAHEGCHSYKCIITPNGRKQYICTLPRCTHSLNLESWIIGKENSCESCGRNFIIDESKELKCEDCRITK